jgi:hypothetical protein
VRYWATGTIETLASGPAIGPDGAVDGAVTGGPGEAEPGADSEIPGDGATAAATEPLSCGVAPRPPPPRIALVPIPAATSSTPPAITTGRRFTAGFWQKKRPVRAGGRGVGKMLDGGPDRIRTGDLQRDRLACWAATPRVQLWRWRSIAEAPALVARVRADARSEDDA